jgi:hypothetical protein
MYGFMQSKCHIYRSLLMSAVHSSCSHPHVIDAYICSSC